MIISICGDINNKNILIKEFKEKYSNKVVICDYFNINFNTTIETESMKYKLMDFYSNSNDARSAYAKYVHEIVELKVNKFFEINKDKIILLIGDNVLCDVYKTSFFDKSDMKILLLNEDKISDDLKFDKELFNVVISKKENIDVRKLMKV